MDGEVDVKKRGRQTEGRLSQPAAKNFCKEKKNSHRADADVFSLHSSVHLFFFYFFYFTHSFIHLFQSIIKPTLLYLHLEC